LENSLDGKLSEFYEDVDGLYTVSDSNQNTIWVNQLRELLQTTNISQSDLKDFESTYNHMRFSKSTTPYSAMKMFIKLLRRKNLKIKPKLDPIEQVLKNMQPLQTIKTQRIQSALGRPSIILKPEANFSDLQKTKEKTNLLSDKIFIVHGQDDNSKLVLENMLREMGLEPIILHKQANKGNTIIEKFEEHADDVEFAFVLFTPDDVGGKMGNQQEQKPRARQNVVLEFGYFLGKLGRRRVCYLYKEGVELPADMHGLVYVKFSSSPEEGYRQIRKELIAAGYKLKPE